MNRWVERIYEGSPVLLQHVFVSAYGLKLARLRYGPGYAERLAELLRTQKLSETELIDLQEARLRELVQHCYDNVPYYENLFRERKLKPSDIRRVQDLTKLPILQKETVRERPELFLARNYASRPCETVGTSGTTGTTLRIRVSQEGRRQNYAFFSRFKHWAGIAPSERSATFAGRPIVSANRKTPPFWRYNLASNNLLFSSYHLSLQNGRAYVDKLRDWNPAYIDSYPSSAYVLSRYISESKTQAPHPKAILTSSETLLDHQRTSIGDAFKAPVFDYYGTAEQVCFVSECEQKTYHVHPEFGILELLPPTGSLPDGARRMIATGFTNWAMPFLRYDTGDLAIDSNRKCVCGRSFKTLERILGRADDFVVTPDGRKIGRLDPVFKGLTTVRQAQIVQDSLTKIRVLLVPGEGFLPEHAESIRNELQKRLGNEITYALEITDSIAVGPGGKLRSVISLVRN